MCIENNLMVAKGEELEEWKLKKKKNLTGLCLPSFHSKFLSHF